MTTTATASSYLGSKSTFRRLIDALKVELRQALELAGRSFQNGQRLL